MAAPIKKISLAEVDKNRSWSTLVVELLTYAVIFVGAVLIYELIWRLVENAQIFFFTKHWLSSAVAVFFLLVVGLLLEYRSFRLHRKLTYLTPFRLSLVIMIVCLFVFVRANAV